MKHLKAPTAPKRQGGGILANFHQFDHDRLTESKGTSTGRELSIGTIIKFVNHSVFEIWPVQQEGICETLKGPNRPQTSRGGILVILINLTMTG